MRSYDAGMHAPPASRRWQVAGFAPFLAIALCALAALVGCGKEATGASGWPGLWRSPEGDLTVTRDGDELSVTSDGETMKGKIVGPGRAVGTPHERDRSDLVRARARRRSSEGHFRRQDRGRGQPLRAELRARAPRDGGRRRERWRVAQPGTRRPLAAHREPGQRRGLLRHGYACGARWRRTLPHMEQECGRRRGRDHALRGNVVDRWVHAPLAPRRGVRFGLRPLPSFRRQHASRRQALRAALEVQPADCRQGEHGYKLKHQEANGECRDDLTRCGLSLAGATPHRLRSHKVLGTEAQVAGGVDRPRRHPRRNREGREQFVLREAGR